MTGERRRPWYSRAVVWGLLKILGCYQFLFSSFFGRSCRFYPTCSSYAGESLRRFGVGRGLLLAAGRVLRCQPFHPGGYDPVPERFPRGMGFLRAKTVSDSDCGCATKHHSVSEQPIDDKGCRL